MACRCTLHFRHTRRHRCVQHKTEPICIQDLTSSFYFYIVTLDLFLYYIVTLDLFLFYIVTLDLFLFYIVTQEDEQLFHKKKRKRAKRVTPYMH